MTDQTTPTQTDPRLLFVQEEYGYRHWIGVIPDEMTTDSIIEWWKSLPSVMGMFFNPSQSFPMPLYEVEDVAHEDADIATWQWVDDNEKHILKRSEIVLFCMTHCDDDSYMKVVGGEYVYHAGYKEEGEEK